MCRNLGGRSAVTGRVVIAGKASYSKYGHIRHISPSLPITPLICVSICRSSYYILNKQGYHRYMSLLQTTTSVASLPFSALGFPGAISIPTETPRYTGETYELSHVLPKLPMYNQLVGINLGVKLNYCL